MNAWGPWRLDKRRRVLWISPPGYHGGRYEVDLDACTTSAQVLDWICQLAGKTGSAWAGDDPVVHTAMVAGLVHALNDVLQLQAHLCGCGIGKQLTSAGVRELVAQAGITTRRPQGA
jgi:hypothetical protein